MGQNALSKRLSHAETLVWGTLSDIRNSNMPTVLVNCPTSFRSQLSTTTFRRPMSGKLPGADGAVGCVAAEVSPAEPVAARGGGGGGKVTVGIGGGGGGATGTTGGGAATDAAGTTAKGAGGIVAAGA